MKTAWLPCLALTIFLALPGFGGRWMLHAAESGAEGLPNASRPSEDPTNQPAAYDPIQRYEPREIEGWRVLVHRDLIDSDAALGQQALKVLEIQLFQIGRVVPAEALAKLRQVTIWVEHNEPHHRCMAYHPNAAWLREHGMNPEKARCVEVANARRFLAWTLDQPWMVLHELAHAYHDQFLGGYDNPELIAALDRAQQAKLYDSVLHIHGQAKRAYALTNPMEYFAESTEAFFGTNDFYPFVRAELQAHDPEMYRLVAKLWGVPVRP